MDLIFERKRNDELRGLVEQLQLRGLSDLLMVGGIVAAKAHKLSTRPNDDREARGDTASAIINGIRDCADLTQRIEAGTYDRDWKPTAEIGLTAVGTVTGCWGNEKLG